jgi:hypothetical protein
MLFYSKGTKILLSINSNVGYNIKKHYKWYQMKIKQWVKMSRKKVNIIATFIHSSYARYWF